MAYVLDIALEGGSLGLSLVADASAGKEELTESDDVRVFDEEDVDRVEVYLVPGARPVAQLRLKDGRQQTFNVGAMRVEGVSKAEEPPAEGERKSAGRKRRGGGD